MTALVQDLRYAVRLLVRNPGVTTVAVLALALGIGALAVTFSVTNAYLLRPLPFSESDRLVHVWSTNERQGWATLRVAVPDFLDWREQTRSFDDLAAFNYTADDLTGADRPEKISTGRVSANVFTLLGVAPLIGRGFEPGEDAPGQGTVAVLSHRFWQTRFQGDPAVLGRTLELSGRPYEIVGVMPPDFVFPLVTTQLWTPRELDTARYPRDLGLVQVVGRLAPGVTSEEAQAEMSAIASRLSGANPDTNADRGVNIVPLRAALNFAHEIFQMMAALLGVANLFVLLIACANVSSLLIGRALGRTREVAVRSALGASRVRLVRQFLIESLVLALAGGAVGMLLAWWGVGVTAAVIPEDLYRIGDVAIDGRALLFSLGATLGTVLLFGLLPAWRAAVQDPGQGMRESPTAVTTSRSGLRLQSALVAGEIGMAATLLVGTALMIRSYQNLQRVDPGFASAGVITMTVSLPPQYEDAKQVAAFHQAALEQVSAVPGVIAAATVNFLPLNHETNFEEFTVPGRDVEGSARKPAATSLSVSREYFTVLGVPLRAGRVFSEADRDGTPRVVIVNETMARNYWPGADPVGARLELSDGEPAVVVGVVGDTMHSDVTAAPGPQIYFAQAQAPWRYHRMLARTAGDPLVLTTAVSEVLWRVDSRIPLVEIRSLEQVVQDFFLPQTSISATLAVLALGALLLAVVGIYGLMSFFVSQRTHEIGIRMALGASPREVLALVLRRGLWLTLAGVGVGVAGAFGLAQGMSSLLYGIATVDPVAFAAVPAILLAVAMLSCYVPARRAATVDPLVSLRYE